jgi:hypothetical protein
MTSFEITKEEIQEIIQYSKQQGGSKYRQGDIYKLLDRVIARGPILEPIRMPDISAKTIICPFCNTGNIFEHGQVTRTCAKCDELYFRGIF